MVRTALAVDGGNALAVELGRRHESVVLVCRGCAAQAMEPHKAFCDLWGGVLAGRYVTADDCVRMPRWRAAKAQRAVALEQLRRRMVGA